MPRVSRILAAGLLTALTDGAFSSVLSVAFYGSTVTRLFQGVAGVLIGREALNGGTPAALIGIAMHFGVAMAWSAIFALGVLRIGAVRRLLESPLGAVKVAVWYGPLVWTIMSLAVIPLMTGRPTAITSRWWTQWFGHMVFVGLPIAAVIRGGFSSGGATSSRSRAAGQSGAPF